MIVITVVVSNCLSAFNFFFNFLKILPPQRESGYFFQPVVPSVNNCVLIIEYMAPKEFRGFYKLLEAQSHLSE